MIGSLDPRFVVTACLVFAVSCGGTLDAGSNRSQQSALPVGPRNPVILTNDGSRDNWHGEYAVLLAHTGGPPLAGIVVSTGGGWFDLDANMSGWQELVTSARASGLAEVPDPLPSVGEPLTRPADGLIESTVPNDSDGARFIIETSLRLSTPELPLAVVTGGRLTDVADAYLVDPTVVDRVVVVSSLGTGFSAGNEVARMGPPNGEMDHWASAIVAQRFRYVQVSAYYDQLTDVPAERLSELPDNAFGAWIGQKQPDILDLRVAADQVGILALGLSSFVRSVTRVSLSDFDGDVPLLTPDAEGAIVLVRESDGAAATAHFWRTLSDPSTFAP